MIQGWLKHSLVAAAMLLPILAAGPVAASPAHPSLAEVNAVVDVLQFRGKMETGAAKAIPAFSTDSGRVSLEEISRQMKTAGGSPEAGWRYLLGTSVFTAAGITGKQSLVVFYNPWIDSALFTLWQPAGKSRRIVDAAWVPGDLVRAARTQIDPRPLWLRGNTYRPEAIAESVVITVKALETRFGDPKKIPTWRETLGIQDAKTYNRLIPPILALTLDENLDRIKALATGAKGEDPKLVPLRAAALGFIQAARTTGFKPVLAAAKDTTAPMKLALSHVNPKTMIGLAPVAFVAGKGQVTMFFASLASADYTISARFTEKGSEYVPAQLELIAYPGVYKAATAGVGVR